MLSNERLKELTLWIKIRSGASWASLQQTVEAYEALMKFIGRDPKHPEVGLDLIAEAIQKIYREGQAQGKAEALMSVTGGKAWLEKR